jgi:5'-nucleotidase
MNILLTNDDGVHSAGLLALKQALEGLAEVTVVAPDRPRSACGHAITLHKPLRVATVKMADGSDAVATTGTPSDCVMLALRSLLPEPPDLVVSGINDGPNLGWDLTYSGTVTAAMEASIAGIPAVAISCVSMDRHLAAGILAEEDELEVSPADREPLNFPMAAEFAAHLVRVLERHRLAPQTLLNVNVPSVPREELQGVRLTRQGVRKYPGQVERRKDPMGRDYYWLGGDLPEDVLEEGTDVWAVAERAVSVTPIHLDLTAYPLLNELHQWTHIEDW